MDNNSETVESPAQDQAVPVEAKVLEEQAPAVEETVEEGKEQPKEDSGPEEESFTGMDINSIKDPELQKIAKSMQADYTKKTQALAGERQEYEQLQSWKNDLESNPYFQQWADDMQRIAKIQQGKEPDLNSMTEEQRIDYMVQQKVNDVLENQVNPRVQTLESERANARVDKFLTDNPTAKDHSTDIAAVMKQHPTVDMDTAWKFVQAEKGLSKESAKKEVLKDLEVKGNANLEMPGKQASQPAKKKGMTVEEAFDLAEKQVG